MPKGESSLPPTPDGCHRPLNCLGPRAREQILQLLQLALEARRDPPIDDPGATTALQPVAEIPQACRIPWRVDRHRVARAALPMLPCMQCPTSQTCPPHPGPAPATGLDQDQLLISTGIATLVLDRHGRIRHYTPAMSRLMSLDPGAVGRPIQDLDTHFAMNPLLQQLRRVMVRNAPEETEIQTDDQRWYLRRALPHHGQDQRLDGVVITFTDITARHRHQQKLLGRIKALRESDRLKNEFLAMLGHELRNPLSPIRYTLDALLHGEAVPRTLEPILDILDRQTRQMQRLVDDLLDVGRITRNQTHLQCGPLDLREVARQALESQQSLIRERHQQLQVELPPEALMVDGDRARLVQVVSNLLGNAAHYTEPGGRLQLTLSREGEQAVIRIQDSGQGIDAALLPQVFDLFIRGNAHGERNHHGLGVGLAVVARLVAMHNGRVSADSPGPGQGSTFKVWLPLLETATATITATASDGPSARSRRVLVMDDEPAVAGALGLLLGAMGHEVRELHGGDEVMAVVAEFHPELVLLDLEMPEQDGFQVARQLRKHHAPADLKLVALSGYGGEHIRQRAREAGFDWYLLKPADWDSLMTLLEDLHWPGLQPSP